MTATFLAKFPSRPQCCDEPIERGDEVRFAEPSVAGGSGPVIHAGCELLTVDLAPGQVCPRCWTEVPVSGECGVCD